MNPTLHRRWPIAIASVGLLIFLIPAGMALWADATNEIFQRKTGYSLADIQPRRIAATITIPTLIAHGTADPTIPLVSARRLFDALPDATIKKWIEIPNADHDNVLVTNYPIYADIAEWMILHVHSQTPAADTP